MMRLRRSRKITLKDALTARRLAQIGREELADEYRRDPDNIVTRLKARRYLRVAGKLDGLEEHLSRKEEDD